ncbi:MAG: carbohydrate kinase family protein [Acidobacteria bacterium]|nr:carbohydrate kinase family protein [Acidobacteriota bacterium]
MASQARLLTVGEAFDDLIFVGLARLPAPGEELRTDRFAATFGGGAVITAIGAARLGVSASIASGLSERAHRRLRIERVQVHNLRRAEEPTAVSVALSTSSDRAFVTFEGINAALEPRFARAVAASRASHVHLAFYPRDCDRWARLATRLRRRGVTVSADFGWNDRLAGEPALPRLIDVLDVLLLNELEAPLYARTATFDEALVYWRRRASAVIIKRGAGETLWLTRQGDVRARPPRARPVDTTGAGDAFNAGFLWAWLRGAPPPVCLAAGNFVGARSTRQPGGLDALPYHDDVPQAIRSGAQGA